MIRDIGNSHYIELGIGFWSYYTTDESGLVYLVISSDFSVTLAENGHVSFLTPAKLFRVFVALLSPTAVRCDC